MNRELLRKYISEYERDFSRINSKELYKWRAVKQFQDTWDPDAENFAEMLSLSLSKTRNLMAAANYWPDRMIVANAEKQPASVREIFVNLFNEENNVLERISFFRDRMKEINSLNFPGKKDYQDERAVLVYLNLRYPDNYYFYKFEMFKTFCEKVEYDYHPKRGAMENVAEYFVLCNTVRDEITKRNSLLKLHTERIGENEYFDKEYNILTQDFIYAVTGHLSLELVGTAAIAPHLRFSNIDFDISQKKYKFTGKFVDHVSKHKRNKHIGDLGEEIVLRHEQDHCLPEFIGKIIQSSRAEGDGLGFDILSYDNNGCEKYIEVKATTGPVRTAFFISGTELERSKVEGEKYFLYRLYNLDENNMTADCFTLQGDLSKYCINPTEYEVILEI